MRRRIRLFEDIEVKQNLKIIARERGKIVARRDGHNIWLDLGREWLANLIGYESYSPDTPQEDNRIKYMGLGIGGTRQLAPATANSGDLLSDYPGTNNQTDTDPTVTVLERPVRVTGGSGAPAAGDAWLGAVQVPTSHLVATSATFRRVFTQTEVSYYPYLTVPLSEIALFTAGADAQYYLNNPVAYDTFDTISKTVAVELEVEWTIRF
jgi:hypothetical protein